MKFLIDEDLPRSACELLRTYEHEAIDVRDVGLRGAKDSNITAYVQANKLCLVTGDFDFSDVRNYPPSAYEGIVVLWVPRDATARFILNVLESFIGKKELVSALKGRLAIVEPGRVRIRKG